MKCVREKVACKLFRANYKYIILHGFIKKSQKIPTKDLNTAQQKLLSLDKI